MFTANSMNSLTEAIGLSLPGNGTILATHENRIQLFRDAARQIVKNAMAYYEDGDESVLPKSIATRKAFLNAMTLSILPWVEVLIPYCISWLWPRRLEPTSR